MKKIILVIGLLLLFLFGCDENENDKKTSQKEDPLNLSTSDNEKIDEFNIKVWEADMGMGSAYFAIQNNIMFSCMYFEDEKVKEPFDDISSILDLEKEKKLCDIFSEIDEKYKYLYEETILNKKAPEQLFSFKIMEEGEEDPNIVGLFPTLEECKVYRNKIEELDVFINNCKIHKSILEELGIELEELGIDNPLKLFENKEENESN